MFPEDSNTEHAVDVRRQRAMSRGARVSILLDELETSTPVVSPTGLVAKPRRISVVEAVVVVERSTALCGSIARASKTCPFCLAVSSRGQVRRSIPRGRTGLRAKTCKASSPVCHSKGRGLKTRTASRYRLGTLLRLHSSARPVRTRTCFPVLLPVAATFSCPQRREPRRNFQSSPYIFLLRQKAIMSPTILLRFKRSNGTWTLLPKNLDKPN
jgi:hypothetical protein